MIYRIKGTVARKLTATLEGTTVIDRRYRLRDLIIACATRRPEVDGYLGRKDATDCRYRLKAWT